MVFLLPEIWPSTSERKVASQAKGSQGSCIPKGLLAEPGQKENLVVVGSWGAQGQGQRGQRGQTPVDCVQAQTFQHITYWHSSSCGRPASY